MSEDLWEQFDRVRQSITANTRITPELADALMDAFNRLRHERDALAAQLNRAPNIDERYGDGCRCQGCGILYVGDLVVPDEIWEAIKPAGKAHGAGMLCANCIMSRVRDLGLWSAGLAFDDASLARRDALMKAEALDDFSEKLDGTDQELAEIEASRYRRKSEEPAL